jgi:hypothetical protein
VISSTGSLSPSNRGLKTKLLPPPCCCTTL